MALVHYVMVPDNQLVCFIDPPSLLSNQKIFCIATWPWQNFR